jgi:hypothetical protein
MHGIEVELKDDAGKVVRVYAITSNVGLRELYYAAYAVAKNWEYREDGESTKFKYDPETDCILCIDPHNQCWCNIGNVKYSAEENAERINQLGIEAKVCIPY